MCAQGDSHLTEADTAKSFVPKPPYCAKPLASWVHGAEMKLRSWLRCGMVVIAAWRFKLLTIASISVATQRSR